MPSPFMTALAGFPEPGNRYELKDVIGEGVCGKVFLAVDTKSDTGRKVAIKVIPLNPDSEIQAAEEFHIFKTMADHPNLPDFYEAFRKRGADGDEIWFVLELCEGGPITDMVLGMQIHNRRMAEEHISFILREIIKTLVFLHENNIIHRDVRGSNILLTRDGEIKLVDFGLSRELDGPLGKRSTCIGSPCWMSPEVVAGSNKDTANSGYGNRADVWAVGITAIELGDGKPPFIDSHPTRVMFQIVRNPPPTLYRPANWSQIYNDFISECLEKNPEHRPFMVELLEHPFFANIPENDYYLTQELKQLSIDYGSFGRSKRVNECNIMRNLLKQSIDANPEVMYIEDLAALEDLTEESIMHQLQERTQLGQFHTYIGDILLILNPNEKQDIYGNEHHSKYYFKSRSDNAPHVYAVADSAYQAILHHEEPQHILLSGESFSGKTTAMVHTIDHLIFLGHNINIGQKITKALAIVHALGNASTPTNANSTRCILETQATFGRAGKISGAIFNLYQLEKWRVSSIDMLQLNFHIFYYFYDAMEAENKLEEYKLEPGRKYRYLRINGSKSKSNRPCDNPKQNFKQFLTIQQNLIDLGASETEIDTIWRILAAILHLGDIQFKDNGTVAEIENPEVAINVAKLLHLDESKFCWVLTNYCFITKGTAERRYHTSDESRSVRDILSNNMYNRLVDWIINLINYKLSLSRAIFGDKYSINILDSFGFESFTRNKLEQIFVNTFCEQMQYHFNQRTFAWEMLEREAERVEGASPITHYDNHGCLDALMGRPFGLLAHIDEASRCGYDAHFITDSLRKASKPHMKVVSAHEFAVAHYAGSVVYDARGLADYNRDFLPPEVVDALRMSECSTVRQLFLRPLTRAGNLSLPTDQPITSVTTRQGRWGAALVKEARKVNFEDIVNVGGNYSQSKRMRTAAGVFRAACLEVLKTLAIGAGSGGTHFVRCIRTDLTGQPKGFHPEVMKQQLKALAVLDSAKARQKGYPHRISFNEFIRRYKFLAFDFEENVEVSKENCRLLLVRLKMEGWMIGKSKVFLKYYNEEYLARLYETQVKKIVKVQCMMRTFLAKRNVANKLKKIKTNAILKKQKSQEQTADNAALTIQRIYRGYTARKTYSPLINKQSGNLDRETADFIKPFAKRWRQPSLYQVLLQYRAAKYQALVNFSQQVHLYNQSAMVGFQSTNNGIPLERIDPKMNVNDWLGERKTTVWKMPFRLDDIPFFDTSYMCDRHVTTSNIIIDEDQESWDTPMKWRNTIASQVAQSLNIQEPVENSPYKSVTSLPQVINIPFCRDASKIISSLFTEDIVHTKSSPVTVVKSPPKIETPKKFISNNKNSLSETISSNGSPFDRSRSPTKIAEYEFEYNRQPKFTPSKFIINKNKAMANPIKEMELFGKKNIDNSTDDDPPFNFQSMLRKTKYNRESMKRIKNDVNVALSEYKSSTPPKKIDMSYDDDFEEPESSKTNLVYECKNQVDKNYSIHTYPKTIITELAPGVTVEGFVSDL